MSTTALVQQARLHLTGYADRLIVEGGRVLLVFGDLRVDAGSAENAMRLFDPASQLVVDAVLNEGRWEAAAPIQALRLAPSAAAPHGPHGARSAPAANPPPAPAAPASTTSQAPHQTLARPAARLAIVSPLAAMARQQQVGRAGAASSATAPAPTPAAAGAAKSVAPSAPSSPGRPTQQAAGRPQPAPRAAFNPAAADDLDEDIPF